MEVVPWFRGRVGGGARLGLETMRALLLRIPGHFIAQALQTLPDAARVSDGRSDGMLRGRIELPSIGRVRITARRTTHSRGRSTRHVWKLKVPSW